MAVDGECDIPQEAVKVIRKMWQTLKRCDGQVGYVYVVWEV